MRVGVPYPKVQLRGFEWGRRVPRAPMALDVWGSSGDTTGKYTHAMQDPTDVCIERGLAVACGLCMWVVAARRKPET